VDAQTRRLVVVRHAKSAWPAGVPDQDRPLGPRGERDAPRMGARIQARLGRPDVAIVSPATRAQQTWQLLAGEIGAVPEVRTDDRIYAQWGDRMIDAIRELPDAVRTALVVGHEPGVSRFVLRVADHANPRERDRISVKFPTCAVAVLALPVPWTELGAGTAALEWFTTPRE
jgi:phosphohistidine phosphatase